ncbi:hypothetical protein ABTL01_19605, partial [Acinetobacter baumannii]
RSAGWPSQDLVEVELLAGGWVERLLDPDGRVRLRVTEAGRALVRHIRSLHASLYALETEVMEFSRGIKGHLRIAANSSAITEALPPHLVGFSQAHGQIRISLEDLTSAEAQAAVAE